VSRIYLLFFSFAVFYVSATISTFETGANESETHVNLHLPDIGQSFFYSPLQSAPKPH